MTVSERLRMTMVGLLLAPSGVVAQVRSFDLAAQPAARSIPEFAAQAGVQIVAPADGLEGVVTPRLVGRLDVRAALRRLLAATPLEIASDDGRTVVLRAARSAGLPAPAPAPAVEPQAAEIVVTGSRIRSTAQTPPAAVISIAADAIRRRFGGISLGDQLSLLPPLRTTVTQAASTDLGVQASGQVGLNLLDLRGIGPARTLVLINGRRVVSSTQLVSQPDTNTIPSALLERVDILTGGASAVYGADAIAGVVNFVLKQDFEGVAVEGQSGISARGDAAAREASVLIGRNLGDRQGNLALAIGHARRDHLRAASRDFAAVEADFIVNPRAGETGQPATIPVRDIRSLAVSGGGTLPYGAPFLRFGADGSLAPATIGAAAFPAIGLSQGGDGSNRIGNASLIPRNERFSATLLGHYSPASGFTIFGQVDAVWQRAEAFAPPAVIAIGFRRDNPLLSAQAQATLDGFAPTAGRAELTTNRALDDLAPLAERNTRSTWRGVAGVRGELGDHLRFELSYGYGRTSIVKDNPGNIDLDRLRLGVDAVRRPDSGAIDCRARAADPGSSDPAIMGCVPIDIFGTGAASAAARDYVALATRSTGRFQQHLASGFVAGDTGGFLRLPGGPLGFVAGVEYRREATRYSPDPRDEQGDTLVSAQRLVGAVDVLEGYAELTAPLVADRPGIERLELGAAFRASRYQLRRLGTRLTGGVNLVYQPLPGVSLRASLQRAMRAPNITELYQPLVGGEVEIPDPCDARFLDDGTPARRGNCGALDIPADFRPGVVPTRVATVTGGNPDLDIERGRTVTAGLVIEPGRLPGVRLALDYYDIDLRDVIAQPGTASLNAATIAAGCVDAASIANPFCPLVRRDPDSRSITDVRQFPINLARLRARGIDIDARWRTTLGSGIRLDWRALATHVLVRDDFRVPGQGGYATRLAGTPNDPRWQATVATGLDFGPVEFSHRLRFLSSVYYRADDVAFFERVNGLPPINPDRREAAFVRTGDYFYHDLRFGVNFEERSEFYLGIDNLFDTAPPFGFTGSGSSGTQFDNVGRFAYAGVRIRL